MKEISLLIFLFGCCYLGYHFIISLIHPHRYRIVFFIPRTSDTNITFGCMFFCFAVTLMCNNIYIFYISALTGFLLLIYGYWQYCYKSFFYGNRCIITPLCKFIANKQIQKQTLLNQKYKHIYNKPEALRILGMQPSTNLKNQIIEKHYQQIISSLITHKFTPSELLKTLELAKQTITHD